MKNPNKSDARGADTAAGGYGDGNTRRVEAPAAELFSLRNQLHWLLGAAECWLFSRSARSLVLGLPFVVAVVGMISLLWWLRHASIDPVLMQFEASFNQAVEADDIDTQELCLSGLIQWRPGVPEFRLRMGKFLVEHDRTGPGLAYILSLAPNGTAGYAPARMWLAQQAGQETPFIELGPDQIEGQLVRVVEQQPENVDAHQMLAELYVNKGEWRLAEKHLLDATRSRPELNLAVAKLKQALKRPQQDVLDYASKAEMALTQRLAANRFDVATRVALVEAKLILGQQVEARELLVSGVQAEDGSEIRRALSDFDLMTAERRLAQTQVNRDVSLQLVRRSVETDPTNPRAVKMLARLKTLGANLESLNLQPAIDFWVQQLEDNDATDSTRSLLSQLFGVAGDPQQAADVLQPLLQDHPDLRLRYAALLKQAGRLEDANTIQAELLVEAKAITEANPDDVVAAARYVEVLMLARKLHEAAVFLRQFADPATTSRVAEDPSLGHFYGIVCLELYDRSIADPTSLRDEDSFELLKDAVQVNTTAGQAVDRLVKIAFSDSPKAAEAEALVDRFRTATNSKGEVLGLLGVRALQAGDGSRARRYLEQANAQARGRNIMLLNNLSVTLLRTEPRDLGRALKLVEQALVTSPGHPDLLSTRGEIFVAKELWAEAAADLKQSVALRPDSQEVHKLLVEVYTALKETSMAEHHQQRLDELQGN
jgi:tetratricopeptide (TPR) repeat protein